jgi:hypothetical protein
LNPESLFFEVPRLQGTNTIEPFIIFVGFHVFYCLLRFSFK